MNDQAKTKKQLIAELEALRRQGDEDEASLKRERAAERLRAEVASMRSGDDLVKVVALMRRQMVDLGIDTHLAAIGFIDEETQRWRWIWALDGFRQYGMRPADVLPPDVTILDEDHVKNHTTWNESPYLIPVWQSGQPYTFKRETDPTGDGSWFTERMGFRELTEGFVTHRPYEQYNTDVPFEHGVVSFAVQEPKDEHVEIVRELTEAVSLGYLRFLDFQQLEQQADQARRERAVERVRAEAMAMRSSDGLLKVIGAVMREMKQIGIDTERCFINFVEEEAELVHSYQAIINPKVNNMTWTSTELVEIDESIVVLLIDYTYNNLGDGWIENWKSGQNWTSHVSASRVPYMKKWYAREYGLTGGVWPFTERDYTTVDVPFKYGTIGVSDAAYSAEHVGIVEELTEAVSLGYLRFLDFEKIDQAQRQLIEELEEELQTAHDLQQGLMPAGAPTISGFALAGHCQPATHVSGDFYQYFERPDRSQILCLADVTGHGMDAAIPMVQFSGILRTEMAYGPTLGELYGKLNGHLHEALDRRTYVCFAMAELEPSTRTVRLANAGCPFPLHYQTATEQIVEHEIVAYPLGARPNTTFPVAEIQLAPGDRLILCSDGIIEAANAQEGLFGFERTAETVRLGCQEGLEAEDLVAQLLERVRAFCGEVAQEDDQTVVVLQG